jgi:hypothetical protein
MLGGCSSNDYGDVLHDPAKAAELQKMLSEKTITDGKIHESFTLRPDGSISFDRQQATAPDKVDRYTFIGETKAWRGPTPINIELRGGGTQEELIEAINRDCWDFNSVDFKVIPTAVKAAEARAESEEIPEWKIDYVSIDKEEIAVRIKGVGKNVTYHYNLDGTPK